MGKHIFSLEKFKKGKEEFHKKQADLSFEEKIEALDELKRMQEFIKQNPIKILPKETVK